MPDSVNAADSDVVIVVRITDGGADRVNNQTPAPASSATTQSAAATRVARRHSGGWGTAAR